MEPLIIAHAGVGTPRIEDDGPLQAAEWGMEYLMGTKRGPAGKEAVDAVVEAVAVMENDPRFDAGLGSYLRLDGSIEMDAAVMDSLEVIGAVIGIKDTKNPVYVARDVLGTPHNLLAGQGAVDFARQMGHEPFDCTTPAAEKRLADVKRRLLGEGKVHYYAKAFGTYARKADYPKLFLDSVKGCDTVGAVARDAQGRFAVAVSSGGISYQLPGRVGDSAIMGAGYYCSKKGAVCATGIGEALQRKVLAKAVYDLIDQGESAREACLWAMDLFDADTPVGIVALTKEEHAVCSNEEMAHAVKAGL